ncbi:spore coat protein YutH [Robertmurraya siralis]|uniref:Spore coat protein YutH n=2 Tax=Bacillaceae TaxID=186817 RepID=A0A920BTP4_9BACI|nr:spore coat protein YutH [Robertmurraya siralis]
MKKMLQRIIQQYYGISIQEQFKLGPYDACRDQQNLYFLVPVTNMEEASLVELEQLALHLVNYGDSSVCQFLKTNDGQSFVDLENQRYCILRAGATVKRMRRAGRKLAKFHYRGRAVPFEVKGISRIGMWKSFWEQRLDQMERVWNEQLFQSPENEFVRMFIESFPYYMGLAENAIQYLSDTEQDDEPLAVDSGTVCHLHFSPRTWGENGALRNPFDWVFDHCARDLAEWTRERYFQNIKTYEPDVRQFYQDYASVSTLSSFSWRLLFSRLLFPLHYMDCVEEYYITPSEQVKLVQEERLRKILAQSQDYEEFLRDFYPLAGAPIRRYQIPIVEWLAK